MSIYWLLSLESEMLVWWSQVNLCTWRLAVWPGLWRWRRRTHLPQNSSRKEKGSKMTSKKKKKKMRTKKQGWPLSKKISLLTCQYGFSLEELLGVIWCVWRQELSCGTSGSNATAAKSGRAQGEERRSLTSASQAQGIRPKSCSLVFLITVFPSETEKFLKDLPRYLS